jgi:hypothetical protein
MISTCSNTASVGDKTRQRVLTIAMAKILASEAGIAGKQQAARDALTPHFAASDIDLCLDEAMEFADFLLTAREAGA